MTASHPQYFIVTDSISPHSNSQQLTVIHCDEPNTGFEPRLISAHFLPAALVGGYSWRAGDHVHRQTDCWRNLTNYGIYCIL